MPLKHMIQWPSTGLDETSITNAMKISNFPTLFFINGNIGQFGKWPIFRFYVDVGGVKHYGVWQTDNTMTFPSVAIDQSAIMSSRVTSYSIYGEDQLSTTGNLLSTICVSSGIQLKQPEISSCMGVSDTVGSVTLNQLHSY